MTTPRSVERLRLFAISLALALAVFSQAAGRTVADTKIDLVVDPTAFLRRALSFWDPFGDGGRIENQAYGYLFPMGPFFVVARWLDVPPWIAQRAWESALVIVAFLGMYLLARALGIRRFWPAVGAGLAYALTPRVLAEIMAISGELLPSMVLPWIMLPLVRGAESGSPRRAAAMSALALTFAGGANGGATLAVLAVPILWLLTRAAGPRRRALMTWWIAAVPLAVFWWVIPLLLLGRYSPPFSDWVEAASNTTSSTSVIAVLRGIPQWEAFLGPGTWPAGWVYAATPVVIVATTAIAAAGLAGLAQRTTPHRVFLWACLAFGLVAVTMGNASRVGPVMDEQVRTLLDGPLLPIRNTHKLQALVTMPIAFGFGRIIEQARGSALWTRTALWPGFAMRLLLAPAALVVAIAAVWPAVTNNLPSASRVDAVAPWWDATGRWLGLHSEGALSLVVPGAPSPTYLWGETWDEALQPVARSPWLVRNAVPLAQPGLIRLIDVIEGRLGAGRSDPSLAPLLGRSGIGFVVVRNDLDSIASEAMQQSLIRLTLEGSPGFELAATIGPSIGQPGGRGWLVDGGAGGPRSAIEIYRVDSASGPVTLLNAAGTIRSNGSSDALMSLVDAGLPTSTPVLFGSDGIQFDLSSTVSVATEGIRRQQVPFGGRFRRSGTLSATAPFSGDRAVYDYLPDGVGQLSTFDYLGIDDVIASSSGADAFVGNPSYPWSALDADPETAWQSASWFGAVGEWLEVRFDEPIELTSIDVAFAPTYGPFPARVEIRTDGASVTMPVHANSALQTLSVPRGSTTSLRLTVREMDGGGRGTSVGIARLVIPGIDPERTLDVPDGAVPSVLRFSAAAGYRPECVAVPGGVACDPDWAMSGEEDDALDRSVWLAEPRSYQVFATVRLTPGGALDRLLDAELAVHATATSTDSTDPRRRPGAAVDGDVTTAWVAAPRDDQPALTLDLGAERPVRAIRIVVDSRAPIARPTLVWVHAGDADWIGQLPRDGLIRLPATATTDSVTVTVIETEVRQSISTRDNTERSLPVGISEIRLDPAPATGAELPSRIEFGCDDGLSIVIDGTPMRMSVSADPIDVLDGVDVPATPCDGVTAVPLESGHHRLRFAGTQWAAPVSLTLSAADLAVVHRPADDVTIERWDATDRRVHIDADATSFLVVHENFNDGWTAQIHGQTLEPVRVDGWQQGFVVSAGTTGVVELSFEPQRAFLAGLLVGAGGIAGLITLAVVRPRAHPAPAASEHNLRLGVGVGLTFLTGAVLIGLPGLFATGIAAVVCIRIVGRTSWVPAVGAPALLAAAGVIVATASSRGGVVSDASSPTIQTLCVGAVALAFLSGVRRETPDPSRRIGRSTTNQETTAHETVIATPETTSVRKLRANG